MTLFVTNAIRVSTGERTPRMVHVPPEEPGRIIADRHGVCGETAPRGFIDGGAPGLVTAAMVPRPDRPRHLQRRTGAGTGR